MHLHLCDDVVEGVIRVMQKSLNRVVGEDGLPLLRDAVYQTLG